MIKLSLIAAIFPGLYDGLGPDGPSSLSDILTVIANVIRILLVLSGFLAGVFIVVGGIKYITSLGNPGNVQKAKETWVNAVLGLGIVLAAYAVVTFIVQRTGG
jgi:hypothetical protein